MEKTYTKIGRIRPDYADVWDSARSYTALEVVKSADAYHAYIAKQDVPAGTPLTDSDYWGEVLDVSDVIAESVAATNAANAAAANADAAREGIQDDLANMRNGLRGKIDGILRSAEGDMITLTDSSDDPVRGLRIFGNTKQMVTTGKNLVDIAGLNPFQSHSVTKPVSVKPGDYKFTLFNADGTQAGFIPGSTYSAFFIDSEDTAIKNNVHLGTSVTQEESEKIVAIRMHYVAAHYTGNSPTFNAQLEAGSREPTEYEPYSGGVPSPSPEYPQSLVSVGDKGSVGVRVTGRNMLPYPYADEVKAENGITFRVNDDQSIIVSGTAAEQAQFIIQGKTSEYIGRTLTLSGGKSDMLRLVVINYTGNNFYDVGNGVTFTPVGDIAIWLVVYPGATMNNEIIRPMLNPGSAPLSYEPAKPAQSLALSTPNGLPGIKVSSGGNYTDADRQMWVCDEIDLGRSVYVKRVGRVDLGTLDWSYYDIYTYFTCMTIPSDMSFRDYDYNTPSGIMCTNYPTYGWDKITSSFNNFIALQETYFAIKTNYYSDVATFKAAMDGVMLYYELTTPIETPLTAEEIAEYQKLKTYRSYTTIYNDSNASMQIDYVMAIESYTSKVAEEVRIDRSPAIVCAAEGNMIALTDSSNDPMRGLRIFGKTEQDGTPTPENPIPLVSVGNKGSIGVEVCGKNIIKWIEVGTNVTFDGNVITFAALGDAYFWITPYCDIPDKTTVTLSFYANDFSGVFTLAPYNDRKKIQNVVPNSRNVLTFTYQQGDGILIDDVNRDVENVTLYNVQLEIGGVATNYEAPKHQSLTALTPNGLPGIPVTSGGNYTDADRQMWICDEIDLERGVYVQRVKALDGRTLEWQINAVGTTEINVQCNIDEVINLASNEDKECRCMCNVFKGVSGYLRLTNYSMSVISGKRLMLTVPYTAFGGAYADGNAANIVKFNEWYQSLNQIDIIYQLATPVETPLTAKEIAAYRALHTNKPNTTVFNDAGAHMAMEYNADAKIYIDNKFAELAAAMLNKA